jgi:outer membrane lipoprotein-sorting protein
MKSLTRIAASLLVISAVAIAIVLFAASSVTWAKVIEKVTTAKALAFTATTSVANQSKPMPMRFLITGDGRTRIESDGSVTITNAKTGELLVLDARNKLATVLTFKNKNKSYGFPADPLEELKQLKGKDAKELGEKEIDGHKVKGFSSSLNQAEYVVWADKTTGHPVRIEWTMPMLGGKSTMVMTDFDVNPKVDEKLFDTTVPAGYKLNELAGGLFNAVVEGKGEDHVIAALRGHAERKQGKFPKRLDDWAAFVSLIESKDGKLSDKDTAFMAHVGAIAGWSFSLPEWTYLGDGVTLGEKDKIVFWYQDPDTKKYRAIYGDLTAKDIDAKDVPRKTEK